VLTISFDVPDPALVPVGCWAAAGVLAWYALAAGVVRWTGYGGSRSVHSDVRFGMWVLSPALVPVWLLVVFLEWFARRVLTPRG
jgi:hypothetical protein